MVSYIRLNLASAIFPFYTDASGRTVMIPQLDENFDRYNAANTVPDKGVPQVFYMHNVMPIAGGFQSIGYLPILAGLPGETDFDTCFNLSSEDSSTVLFVPAGGKNYVFDGSVGGWNSVSPITPPKVNSLVTVAYVKGVSYIYYENYGCYKYDTTTHLFVPVTLTGLTATDVIGICESNGYMIAWTDNAIAWSSISDPTNFVPSIQTGAGGGALQERKGKINFCVKMPSGFIAFCEQNSVGCRFSSNTDFPFIFRAIPGSGGVNAVEDAASQASLPYFPAMTTAGIQQVSIDDAISTMQDVSDFLTSGVFEDYDDVTNVFSIENTGGQLGTKFTAVANRWIVISYGFNAPDYTHAIVYDMALNRYGKLKLPHRACFQYVPPDPYGQITYAMLMHTPISALSSTTYAELFTGGIASDPVPKYNLAFLQSDGTIQLVDFDVLNSTTNGTFIIGKFQHVRNKVITHQVTEIETIRNSDQFSFLVLPTLNGKDWLPAVPATRLLDGDAIVTYGARVTGKNISLVCKGSFNLTTMILRYTTGGWR